MELAKAFDHRTGRLTTCTLGLRRMLTLQRMPQTDFSVFRERLAEACHARNMTHDAVCRSIGMGGRRLIDLHHQGLKALDLYRVCQIADRLDVSVDWLLGRTGEMEMPESL